MNIPLPRTYSDFRAWMMDPKSPLLFCGLGFGFVLLTAVLAVPLYFVSDAQHAYDMVALYIAIAVFGWLYVLAIAWLLLIGLVKLLVRFNPMRGNS